MQLGRLGLLDHPEPLPRGRVKDDSRAQPERDVVHLLTLALGNQIAWPLLALGHRCPPLPAARSPSPRAARRPVGDM